MIISIFDMFFDSKLSDFRVLGPGWAWPGRAGLEADWARLGPWAEWALGWASQLHLSSETSHGIILKFVLPGLTAQTNADPQV